MVTTPFWLLPSVEAGDAAEHFITPGQPHIAKTGLVFETGLVSMLRMLGLRKPPWGKSARPSDDSSTRACHKTGAGLTFWHLPKQVRLKRLPALTLSSRAPPPSGHQPWAPLVSLLAPINHLLNRMPGHHPRTLPNKRSELHSQGSSPAKAPYNYLNSGQRLAEPFPKSEFLTREIGTTEPLPARGREG